MLKSYNNLKIKSKLLISFSIMAVIAVLIGIFGIIGIHLLRQADNDMYVENTQPMGELASMYDTLASQRICAANMVIFNTTDPQFAQDETAALAEKEQLFESSFAAYKETVSSTEEQALYDQMNTQYTGPFAAAKAELRAAVQSGDTAAMATAMKNIDDLGAEISGYMDEAFSLNVAAAQSKVDSNTTLAGTSTIVQIVVIIAGIAMAVFCSIFLANLIARPMNRIMTATKQVGETGSMDFPPELITQIQADAQSEDELGQTALNFARMMDSFMARSALLEQIAEGDLAVQVKRLSEEDTLGNAMRTMLTKLNDMFGEINASTEQVTSASGQIATGAQTLAQATTEQSATVEELLATVSEVAERTRDNAQRAETAATLSGDIKDNAQAGSEQMDRMIQAVEEINAASQSISAVIKVIDDIAFQTNILALNAAVEAARAGEHGKGFAVVADEVRNLAGKSAEAAKDTSSLIANTVEKAELGAQIAKETSASLEVIVSGINESTSVVHEIATSSEEQSVAIEELNKGIDQVSEVVQQNSATAEESAAAAEEMSSQATMLKSMVSRFKLYENQAPALTSSAPAYSLPAASDTDVLF